MGFSDPALLNNRIVVTPLAMGEPVLESHLAPEGSRAGLSALIGQGKRAMAVHVNDVAGWRGLPCRAISWMYWSACRMNKAT